MFCDGYLVRLQGLREFNGIYGTLCYRPIWENMISLQQWHALPPQGSRLNKTFRSSFVGPSTLYLQRFTSTNGRIKDWPKIKTVQCRSELSHDAPLAIAIGTCVLNSIVFPVRDKSNDEDGESMEDVRYAAMGIISFIPLFNWLSWVFAWLDTGRQRYLVYAIVYLSPYIRTDLSLSPEDTWLPIASILICILHIQLEISLKSGGLQDFQLFGDPSRLLSDNIKGKRLQEELGSLLEKFQTSKLGKEELEEESVELPSEEEDTQMEFEEWDDKMKSILKDKLAREEGGIGDVKDISKATDGLGKDDSNAM